MIRRLNHELVLSLLPDRNPWGHKGNFGKLLLLCGSRGYTGAAFFAAMGALRAGAGLVFLGVPESIYGIEAVKLNEPVIFPLPDAGGRLSADAVPEILTRLPQMDAVLVGPGLGQSEGTLAVVRAVLEKAECPVVVDADGINVLSAHRDLLRGRKSPTILTPHDGEFARLGGVIGEDRMAAAAALAEELGCVVLLKGHETCITDGTDGQVICRLDACCCGGVSRSLAACKGSQLIGNAALGRSEGIISSIGRCAGLSLSLIHI